MIETLANSLLITASLLLIVYLIAGKIRGPVGPEGPRGPEGPQGPAAAVESHPPAPAVRSDLVQVLKQRDGDWQHHAWAQLDSDAHIEALRQPGLAVRRHGETDLDFGTQVNR